MCLEILIVRHGQSEGNRDRRFTGHGPSRLTALGLAQAEATARSLAARPVDVIYTSDLLRCVETAAPLARATGVQPIESPLLRERDVGEFTGLTFGEVQARWPDGWRGLASRDVDFRPPGGESHRDCSRRVGDFLDRLLERHPEGRVVLFSHGVAINHLLRHALGVDPTPPAAEEGGERTLHVSFTVDNCSLQRLEHHATHRTWRVLALNDVAHLAGLGQGAP